LGTRKAGLGLKKETGKNVPGVLERKKKITVCEVRDEREQGRWCGGGGCCSRPKECMYRSQRGKVSKKGRSGETEARKNQTKVKGTELRYEKGKSLRNGNGRGVCDETQGVKLNLEKGSKVEGKWREGVNLDT